jgi:hypothetical protein
MKNMYAEVCMLHVCCNWFRDAIKNVRDSNSETEDSGADMDMVPPPRQLESRSHPAVDKNASHLSDRELTPPPVFPSMSMQQQHPSRVLSFEALWAICDFVFHAFKIVLRCNIMAC